MGLAALTGLDTPSVGALEQNIFYVSQMMQFGKLLAVLRSSRPFWERKRNNAKVPVLRNLVPAQVLAGKSSFNSGTSISAGLPVYARNQIKAIAALLEHK